MDKTGTHQENPAQGMDQVKNTDAQPISDSILLLAEIRKLSARLSNLEAEMQQIDDSLTCTPSPHQSFRRPTTPSNQPLTAVRQQLLFDRGSVHTVVTSAITTIPSVTTPVTSCYTVSSGLSTVNSACSTAPTAVITNSNFPIASTVPLIIGATTIGQTSQHVRNNGWSSNCSIPYQNVLASRPLPSYQAPRVFSQQAAVGPSLSVLVGSGGTRGYASPAIHHAHHGQPDLMTQGIAAQCSNQLPHPQNTSVLPNVNTLHPETPSQQHSQVRDEQVKRQSGQVNEGKNVGVSCHSQKPKVEVSWPQDHCFVGQSRKRLTYNELNHQQFILGFLRSIMIEKSPTLRANMLAYLTELCQNICDNGFQQSKGAHHVVLSQMEDGLLTWGQLKKCHKVRKTYLCSNMAQRGTTEVDNTGHNSGKKRTASVPCRDYQSGRCRHTDEHDKGSVTYKHICAYCLYTTSRLNHHQEQHCLKKKQSQNRSHSYLRDMASLLL